MVTSKTIQKPKVAGTAKRKAKPVIVTVDALRKKTEGWLLPLPSGVTVKVKKPGLYDLVSKGIFKFTALQKMEEVTEKYGGIDPEKGVTALKDLKKANLENKNGKSKKESEDDEDETFKNLFELFYRYATIAICDPVVMLKEEAEEAGLTEKDYVEPSVFDFTDLLAVFTETMQVGALEIAPFR